jgi:hypothetical protein
MDNDNAKKINDSLNNLNKIMSLILVLAFDGSTFKSKTNDEIKKVMPELTETLKSIHEEYMIELSFIIGCLLIVLIGVYLMKANNFLLMSKIESTSSPLIKLNQS